MEAKTLLHSFLRLIPVGFAKKPEIKKNKGIVYIPLKNHKYETIVFELPYEAIKVWPSTTIIINHTLTLSKV